MANLKNITDLPMAASAEGLNLIVNDNGAAKQIPADSVGKVKSVNGAQPDANGNVEIEIPEGFSGSWNDLKDKPFDSEGETCVLLENITLEDTGDDYRFESFDIRPLEIGELVTVELFDADGDIISVSSATVENINGYRTAETDTWEILILFHDDGRVSTSVVSKYRASFATITVSNETVRKIDPKYIPDNVGYDLMIGMEYSDGWQPQLLHGTYRAVLEKMCARKCPIVIVLNNIPNTVDRVACFYFEQVIGISHRSDPQRITISLYPGDVSSKWVEIYPDNSVSYGEYND